MTAFQVKGGGDNGVRAGGYALSLLATPLNAGVLQALAKEPKSLVNLRRETGSPPQTTMRKHLRVLTQLDVVARKRRDEFPGALDYELTNTGRELLAVAEVLQTWLAAAPDGPLSLGTLPAKSSVKALAEGWSTTLIRALVAKPLSLTELDALITGLSYPSLERRLLAMRLAGQVEASPGRSRGTPYIVTDWLRRAVGPLVAAARWERRHAPAEAAPISRLDIEASFLLVAPLLRLPADLSGLCRLAVEVSNGSERRLAGALVGVEEGQVAYCRARLEGDATAWASGSATAWLHAVMDRDTDRLEIGGDCGLARAILDGLNNGLCRAPQKDRRPSEAHYLS